ncbi:hypothetical protein [Streptomyces sp. NPDC002088]|uniref:hypothetical protein n=1 Tax=Streptomyces sp. NPDC002088 TaxID=3154665 RepID=UPI0033203C6F
MDLATAAPVEIDTALAAAYGKIADLTSQQQRITVTVSRIDEAEPGSYESMLPAYSPENRTKLVDEIAALQERIQKILQAEVYPCEAQYNDRRWTRYYLVDNVNGHVHKDTKCSTCFVDTRYAWLTEQSGLTAEELVGLAGEKACTVCFPWAPVDVLKQKTRLEAPERKAARLEREAKRAEREAKRAAKAIANPDGSPLKVFTGHYPERQVMRGGVVVKVHPAHDAYDTLTTLHAARGWLTDAHESWRGGAKRTEDVHKVADAVAHKEGKTREQVIEEAKKRAARRK